MRPAVITYGLALLAVAAAVALRWLLDPFLGNTLVLVTLYGAVAFALWVGGFGPALLAALAGYFAANYLFAEPRYSLTVSHPRDIVGLLAYLFTCSIIATLGGAMRAAQHRAEERGGMLEREVTERKAAEEQTAAGRRTLARLQQQFVALADSSDHFVAMCDMNFAPFYVNEAGMRMVGLAGLEQAKRTPVEEFFFPEDRARVREEFFPRVVRDGRGEIEIRFRHFTTHEPLWVIYSVVALKDEDGKPSGFGTVTRDITDRKRAEDALATRAAQQAALYRFTDRLHRAPSLQEVYDAALEAICDALKCTRASILLFDDAGVMQFVAWCGLSDGYRRAVTGHSPWKPTDTVAEPIVVADIDKAEIDDALRATIKAEGIAALGFIPLMAGGRVIGKFMVYYDAPNAIGSEGLDVAVTIARQLSFAVQRQGEEAERRRTEEALRQSEERLRLATQTGKVGVWDWDILANRASWTDSLYAMNGLGKDDFDGTVESFSRLVHADDRGRVGEAIERSLAGQTTCALEFRTVRPDGKIVWLVTHAAVLRDEGGKPTRMIGATVDITETKQAEERLRDADRRKDEFLATLAHELRNPLAPISNALEVMKRAGSDAALIAEARDTMERQLRHMVRLVDDLLDVSRITRDRLELRREPVELSAVVAHAAESCRPLIEAARHHLSISLPAEPVRVSADPARLAQVLGNLLTNASKYTEPGGRIALEVQRDNPDQVTIRVSDNGLGIPPEMLPRVFDMFTQVDRSPERSQGGLGIGLSLVKRLVEMHGGTVEAHSEGPGHGSEFVVRLPTLPPLPTLPTLPAMTEVGPASVEAPGRSPANASPTRRRVLVVDDNEDSAHSLARLLRLSGHETEVAHDGVEAIAQAGAFDPDAILLDIGLPKLSGYDACRAIRGRAGARRPLMIALTGWGQEEDRRKTAEAGFDAHLVKPISYDAITQLLNGDSANGR